MLDLKLWYYGYNVDEVIHEVVRSAKKAKITEKSSTGAGTKKHSAVKIGWQNSSQERPGDFWWGDRVAQNMECQLTPIKTCLDVWCTSVSLTWSADCISPLNSFLCMYCCQRSTRVSVSAKTCSSIWYARWAGCEIWMKWSITCPRLDSAELVRARREWEVMDSRDSRDIKDVNLFKISI